MEIKRTIHFEARVSDELFFWMLRAGIELDDEAHIAVITSFPFDNPDEVVEQIDDEEVLDQWWRLVSETSQKICSVSWGSKSDLLKISSIEIRPWHPEWDWEYVITYDTCTYEKFLEELGIDGVYGDQGFDENDPIGDNDDA